MCGRAGDLSLILAGDEAALFEVLHDGGQIFGAAVVLQAVVAIQAEFGYLLTKKILIDFLLSYAKTAMKPYKLALKCMQANENEKCRTICHTLL